MNQDITSNTKLLRVVATGSAALFSLIATILAFSTDFGGWWEGYSWNYYYWIGSETAPGWSIIFIVLLALLFLGILIYSILLIIVSLGKITLPFNCKIQAIIGIVLATGGFILTALMVGIMAIIAAGYDWWLETSFYSSLVGSIIIGIFYVFYFLLASREDSSSPAK
ncbi:MAG: hypothetical protein ACFFDW_00820 [Candidatus Thorarchaeota archaeon]